MRRPKDQDDPTGIVILRADEICERVAVSKAYLYGLIGAGQFPPFVPLGAKSVGLPEHVLDAWLWQCLEMRLLMSTLRDPVALPAWPPLEVVPSMVSGIRMLRLPTVSRRVGLRKSQIYRNIEDGTFPKPVPLGPRARRWAAHEIVRWMGDRLRMLSRLRQSDRTWYLRPPQPRDDDDDRPGPESRP